MLKYKYIILIRGRNVMKLEENTLREETVYRGEFINISKLQVKLPDGNIANREVDVYKRQR